MDRRREGHLIPIPTPIYIVEYDNQQLPGYAQQIDRPVVMKSVDNEVIARENLITDSVGAEPRRIGMTFLVKSRLSNSTGLQHLDDCEQQWEDALKILTRNPGMKELFVHGSVKYFLAKSDRISMPILATQSRSMSYSVDFTAQPWAIAVTPATQSFSGNGAISVAIGDSRKTYPIFTVPASVTAFTATDENGKVLNFVRGAHTGIITIDCGEFIVINNSGVSAVTSMTTLAFGLNYNGTDGTYGLTITNYAGSGSVVVDMYGRYEI